MELKDYWHTLRRRWKVVALCLFASVGVAGLLALQATPQYASSARLFVSTSESDTSAAYQGGLFASQRVTSYADLANSRHLAERVSDDLGGTLDPDALTGIVEAQVIPETVILQITATDPDPVQARDIAQAYAQGLSDLVADLETPAGRSDALIQASIVDNAQVSASPVSPQPVRNLGLAAVLGLLLGVGAGVARDLMDTSVSSTEDVAAVTTAPLLGHITADAAAARKPPAEALSEMSNWAEAFCVLRAACQHAVCRGRSRPEGHRRLRLRLRLRLRGPVHDKADRRLNETGAGPTWAGPAQAATTVGAGMTNPASWAPGRSS